MFRLLKVLSFLFVTLEITCTLSQGFGPDLSFLDDPNFPGNSGWNKKMEQAVDFKNDPMFPGNPEWLKKYANPSIPKFPPNFPFPQDCNKTSDPGFRYPSIEVVSVGSTSRPTIRHEAFICRDHRYKKPFYLLKTESIIHGPYGSQNTQSQAIYYTKDGKEFNFEPEVNYTKLYPSD